MERLRSAAGRVLSDLRPEVEGLIDLAAYPVSAERYREHMGSARFTSMFEDLGPWWLVIAIDDNEVSARAITAQSAYLDLFVAEPIQDAAVDHTWQAIPICREAGHPHPLSLREEGGDVFWVCPKGDLFRRKVGELAGPPSV